MKYKRMPENEEKKFEINTSKQFTVDWIDLRNSLLITLGTTALLLLYPIINSGRFPTPTEWKSILLASIAACLSNIIRKFFTPSATIVKIQPPDANMDTHGK